MSVERGADAACPKPNPMKARATLGIGYAAISPLVARNEYGRMVPGAPRIAGTFAATLIASQTWYPERNGWKDGLRSGAISLGTTALFNMAKEFIRRK